MNSTVHVPVEVVTRGEAHAAWNTYN
jgi:hypothetical protein